MIVFKDKYGVEFAYLVRATKNSIGVTAIDASEIINKLPPYLRKNIERVSFLDEENPLDEYWRIAYNDPKHCSLASDGGKTTFWMPCPKEQFKKNNGPRSGPYDR